MIDGDVIDTTSSLRDFLRRPRTTMQLALDEMPHPPMPPAFRDWKYWDMPGTISGEEFGAFMAMLGRENFKILDILHSVDNTEVRAQFWISPEGMKRLGRFVADA